MVRSPVSVVGAGRTGRALGRLVHRAGIPIGAVTSRTLERAREAVAFIGAGTAAAGRPPGRSSGIVLVCVPDGAVAEVAAGLDVAPGTVVAHVAGALGSEAAAGARGAEPGSLHPLRSFADPERAAASFAGTACAVEGTPPAAEALRELVRRIGGVPLEVASGGKPLYHAGAVFASNYVVALLHAAERLFEAAGIPREAGRAALGRLAEGTLENVKASGPEGALTGPVERGDDRTVARHLEALRRARPDLAAPYAALGRMALELARSRGSVGGDAAARVAAALESP
jgi:predicted short-subunit dehydrogenase-like oxidoreductase (DUF2520 family)